MIISRTPFRISFFGGGTDYPAWYKQHGGTVLTTTIDKYCYLACRYYPPFFDHSFRISYIKSENCRTIDEISHPAVRGVLKHMNWKRGLEIHHVADLPARGGMGSSSSFTVGLLHALYGLRGAMPSKQHLAEESVFIEQELLKETVGSQDQTAAAFGGLNQIVFATNGVISVKPLTISADRVRALEGNLMLFYTGIKRTASDVARSYVLGANEKMEQMTAMSDLVNEGIALLHSDRDIAEFGRLIDQAWRIKRGFSTKVSNSHVDEMYEMAISAEPLEAKFLAQAGGDLCCCSYRLNDKSTCVTD